MELPSSTLGDADVEGERRESLGCRCGDIRRDISYQRAVNAVAPARLLVRSFRWLSWLLLLLSAALNLVVLSTWVAPESRDANYTYSVSAGRWAPLAPSHQLESTLFGLGLAHVAVASLLLLAFLLAQKPSFPALNCWRGGPRFSELLAAVV